VSRSSEFCRHNPLCCFSTSVYCCLFRYRLRPETFGYTLVYEAVVYIQLPRVREYWCDFVNLVINIRIPRKHAVCITIRTRNIILDRCTLYTAMKCQRLPDKCLYLRIEGSRMRRTIVAMMIPQNAKLFTPCSS